MPSQTEQTLRLLRRFESRNVTFIDPDGSWPIVWDRAKGEYVWDADGKKYVDLTAAFGVAAAGHANPRVVRAGQRQLAKLPHAMGDVHPHALKARLCRELSRLTFERWHQALSSTSATGSSAARAFKAEGAKTIFCNSGFEAVEAALKTAFLATHRRGIVAFRGAYHGLGYGALSATHRSHFRGPFLPQLGKFGRFVDFPVHPDDLAGTERAIRQQIDRTPIGAVLVEPIQTRGGINVPPRGFLAMLRRLCDSTGALLILDEIYTGFGRTGKWFACEHEATIPDLICLGKALTGGFPLSACVGRRSLMDQAWPESEGEAIHTSTYLGNPVGCAMALAQIEEIRSKKLVDRAESNGAFLLELLCNVRGPKGLLLAARGLGLLVGLELRSADGQPATKMALGLIKSMLRLGYLLLAEGEHANVIAFTPPLTATKRHLNAAVSVLQSLLDLSRNRTEAPTSHDSPLA